MNGISKIFQSKSFCIVTVGNLIAFDFFTVKSYIFSLLFSSIFFTVALCHIPKTYTGTCRDSKIQNCLKTVNGKMCFRTWTGCIMVTSQSILYLVDSKSISKFLLNLAAFRSPFFFTVKIKAVNYDFKRIAFSKKWKFSKMVCWIVARAYLTGR